MQPHRWAFLAGQLRELGGDVDRSGGVSIMRSLSRWSWSRLMVAFWSLAMKQDLVIPWSVTLVRSSRSGTVLVPVHSCFR